MVSRKRGRAEMESSEPRDMSLLDRLRNMWQFSNLMQYIFIFGKAVKIDEDFTIEDLETECLKPEPSEKLSEIGLALLKYVSSHRGLTSEIFDEYVRRQYVAKAPSRNPFGVDENPKKFADFDVFAKLRVLSQLSQWTLINIDRIREKMPETKDSEQIQWRIEEIGYDKEERLYFVLDDNRLYRRTDPPPPPPPAPKLKANSKRGKAAARASRRRKTADAAESANDAEGEYSVLDGGASPAVDDDFGGRKWECIAITLRQYQEFLEAISKSRDVDEKELHQRITEDVLPVIEKAEESQLRRLARKERELMNMQKLATAKRSSRLAVKMEKEREEHDAIEAERRRKADLIEARKDQERQKTMEEARESRMKTREQRLKEREYKRILQEEELASLSEDNKKLDAGEARMSERRLKAEMEKRRNELAALAQEDVWSFDCSVCGIHGENVDDGTHSVACEKCNVWQHSACLGISQVEAEKDDFHFICHDCRRRAEDAMKPKIPALKFHLGSSSSPPSQKTKEAGFSMNVPGKWKSGGEVTNMPPMKKFKYTEPKNPPLNPFTSGRPQITQVLHKVVLNGPTLSPQGQVSQPHVNNNPTKLSALPGLRSPGPAIYSDEYANNAQKENGYPSQLPNQSPDPLSSTANGTIGTPPTTGWSARYSSHQISQPSQQTQYSQSQNPFLNSFERQRPRSSHSTNNILSPIKNRPSLSPPRADGNSFITQTPATNGSFPRNLSSTAQPPAFSPVKHQSSPPMAVIQHVSSSPVIHPLLQQNPPSSPGLSPTKQSPPRSSMTNDVASTPVLPPVQALSPSPRVQILQTPVKGLGLSEARSVNGHTNGE